MLNANGGPAARKRGVDVLRLSAARGPARALGGERGLHFGAPCLHGLAERWTLLLGNVLHSLDERRNGSIATNVFDAQLLHRRGISCGGNLGQRRGLALFKFFECHKTTFFL